MLIRPAAVLPPTDPASRPAARPQPLTAAAASPALEVAWASHQDEVREAQRLRFDVFTGEMGATLAPGLAGHDIDLFDDFCEHLLVRDAASRQVIGTYRVLTPVQAQRVGGLYSETEFDLTRLHPLRFRLVELGRSCVHPQHRHGAVILALWSALAGFMQRNRLDYMVGCASIPMRQPGPQGLMRSGQAASGIWRQLARSHLAAVEHQVFPRLPLPLDPPPDDVHVEPPALISAYLRMGARVMGPPAWDPDFNVADLPLILRLSDLPSRYRRHLLGNPVGPR